MKDRLEIEFKNEIDDIKGRIDTIMKKIDALAPEPEEEDPQEEQPPEKVAKIIQEEKDISEETS